MIREVDAVALRREHSRKQRRDVRADPLFGQRARPEAGDGRLDALGRTGCSAHFAPMTVRTSINSGKN
jgi:hypothetical protein